MVQVLYLRRENNMKKIIDKNFHQQYDHAMQWGLVMLNVHRIYQRHEQMNQFLRKIMTTSSNMFNYLDVLSNHLLLHSVISIRLILGKYQSQGWLKYFMQFTGPFINRFFNRKRRLDRIKNKLVDPTMS